MKNTFKLIWTEEAIAGLREIIVYLESQFSEKEIKKFIKKLNHQIELIKSNPEAFPFTQKQKNIRRTIVSKLTSIYFCVKGDVISIITIYDNRKNPNNLNI